MQSSVTGVGRKMGNKPHCLSLCLRRCTYQLVLQHIDVATLILLVKATGVNNFLAETLNSVKYYKNKDKHNSSPLKEQTCFSFKPGTNLVLFNLDKHTID